MRMLLQMRMLSLTRNVVDQWGCGCSIEIWLINKDVVAQQKWGWSMRMLSLKKYGWSMRMLSLNRKCGVSIRMLSLNRNVVDQWGCCSSIAMWLINEDVVAQQECDCSMRMLSLDRNVVALRGCCCSTERWLLMRMLSLKRWECCRSRNMVDQWGCCCSIEMWLINEDVVA